MTHFAGGGVVGEFVRDPSGAVIGHKVLSARINPPEETL